MSVVVEDENGKKQMITKGAIEEMPFGVSSFVEYDGRVTELTGGNERAGTGSGGPAERGRYARAGRGTEKITLLRQAYFRPQMKRIWC